MPCRELLFLLKDPYKDFLLPSRLHTVLAYEENTVFSQSAGQNTGNGPLIEKELYPQISGIVISAQGGDLPSVQAEISQAMEALFGLEPHKIKVLKRVE